MEEINNLLEEEKEHSINRGEYVSDYCQKKKKKKQSTNCL